MRGILGARAFAIDTTGRDTGTVVQFVAPDTATYGQTFTAPGSVLEIPGELVFINSGSSPAQWTSMPWTQDFAGHGIARRHRTGR